MFNNKDTRMLSIDVVLVSLLITLNTVNIMLGHFIFIYILFCTSLYCVLSLYFDSKVISALLLPHLLAKTVL